MASPIIYRRCRTCNRRLFLKLFPRSKKDPERYALTCLECNPSAADELDRDRYLQATYGITLDHYDRLLARQRGCCAICGRKPHKRALAVDHCHRTQRVRGLLCTRCNTVLGATGDSVKGIMRFVRYLRKWPRLDTFDLRACSPPRRLPVTRYILPDGSRVSKDTPGASAVRVQTETYYVTYQGRRISLGVTTLEEAQLKLLEIAQPIAHHFEDE